MANKIKTLEHCSLDYFHLYLISAKTFSFIFIVSTENQKFALIASTLTTLFGFAFASFCCSINRRLFATTSPLREMRWFWIALKTIFTFVHAMTFGSHDFPSSIHWNHWHRLVSFSFPFSFGWTLNLIAFLLCALIHSISLTLNDDDRQFVCAYECVSWIQCQMSLRIYRGHLFRPIYQTRHCRTKEAVEHL